MEDDLGRVMLDKGILTREQLQTVELASQIGDFRRGIDPGDSPGKIAILLGFADPKDVAVLLAQSLGVVTYVLIDGYPVDPHLCLAVPQEFAEKNLVLPLVREVREMALVLAAAPLAPDQAREMLNALGVRSLQFLPVSGEKLSPLTKKAYESLKNREVHGVRLGEILVREGVLKQEDLGSAIASAQAAGLPLGKYLVRAKMVDEEGVAKILAGMADVSYLSYDEAAERLKNSTLKQRLKKEYVRFNMLLPFAVKNRTLQAITVNPFVKAPELPHSYGCTRLEIFSVAESTFSSLFIQIYKEPLAPEEARDLATVAKPDGEAEATLGTQENEDDIRARYSHLLDRLILKAIEVGSSDIHIENYEAQIQVRLRVDGVLHVVSDSGIDKETLRGVINILKIEGGMNIAENRTPQGGSFRKIAPDGSPFDFRVQIMPTVNGEAAVVRLLPGKKRIPTLREIGFPPRILDGFERAVNNPSGLVLVTGPTGSGKTTTLCSALAHVAQDPTCKVLTVEDPVEYQLPNVTQVETIPSKGVDFAAAARGFMRMDPDVILIGEIRDEETANEALKLAYSGHLTFSTLHTSSAVSTVERMLGFGLDRTLLVEQMLAICSQRLMRRLCVHCREPYEPVDADMRSVLYQGIPEGMRFYQAKGCSRCNGLGHAGRTMLAEFLNFTGNTRATFRKENEQNRIYVQLMGKGLEPMIDDAFNKVHRGHVDVRWLTEVIPQDYLEMGPSNAIDMDPGAELFMPPAARA